MTLGEKQELFAQLLVPLLTKAHTLGFGVRIKEVYRAPEQCHYNATHCGECGKEDFLHVNQTHPFTPIGIEHSLHGDGLAVDLILTHDQVPIWRVEDYRELGEFWESLDPLCYWGGPTQKDGDRLKRDGVHFSITHNGKQ